jgi:hypothetical protein
MFHAKIAQRGGPSQRKRNPAASKSCVEEAKGAEEQLLVPSRSPEPSDGKIEISLNNITLRLYMSQAEHASQNAAFY